MDDLEEGAVERQEGIGRGADTQGGDTDHDGNDEDLQDVEAEARGRPAIANAGRCLQADEVGRDQTLEEIEPGPR
ncbi:hypothetical protein D3C87_2036150 [compost metagenome]